MNTWDRNWGKKRRTGVMIWVRLGFYGEGRTWDQTGLEAGPTWEAMKTAWEAEKDRTSWLEGWRIDFMLRMELSCYRQPKTIAFELLLDSLKCCE